MNPFAPALALVLAVPGSTSHPIGGSGFHGLDGDGFAIENAAQGFRSRVTQEEVTVSPLVDGEPWRLRLRTTHFGRGAHLERLLAAPPVRAAERLTLDRGALTEWFAHDARGLEQGWDISTPPAGQGAAPLALRVGFAGLLPVHHGVRITLVDADGRARLAYSELAAWDARGAALPARFQVDGATVTLLVDDASAVYPVTVDPLLSGPFQTLVGGQAASRFGTGLATAGDVNGDGYGDVLVGAPRFDGALSDEGRAYLYYGTPAGLSTEPAWFHDGGQAGARLGSTVGFAGDVNGDGYSDLLVGVPYFDTSLTNAGQVRLFLGAPGGPSTTPDWVLNGFQDALFLGAAYTAGDVNGDGYGDVVIGAALYDGSFSNEGLARVYLGSATGLASTPVWSTTGGANGALLGASISAAGDVDGDGYDDVIVGAPGVSSSAGEVRYFPGSPAGPSLAPTWTASGYSNAEFGASVDTAGDANGDGHADLLIGAPNAGTGIAGTQTGAAFVYLGGPAGPENSSAWLAGGGFAGERVGESVATAGDLNGDGYGDVVVGTPFASFAGAERGHLSAYLGDALGLDYSPLWQTYGAVAGEHFGSVVASAGDVNADGFGDVVGAAPDANLVRLFLGGGEPFADRIGGGSFTVASFQDDENLGQSVAGAGDVNGDGLDDVLVGAPGYDGSFNAEGRALLYLAPLGVTTPLAWSVAGGQASARSGEAVAGAGDVDGDGYDDVLVGTPGWTGTLAKEGKVELFRGGPGGVALAPSWSVTGGQAQARLGRTLAGAGDLDGDGFADVVIGAGLFDGSFLDGGKVEVYLGSASGLSGSPDWTFLGEMAGALLGSAADGAGDVNGDGYDDLVVGANGTTLSGPGAGRAYLFLGGPSGLATTPSWTDELDEPGAHFGRGVGGAGDVNGDGYDDLVIGAPDRVTPAFTGGTLYVYHGSPSGPGPRITVEESSTLSRLGVACGTAGDVNGDGYADVVAGQPGRREARVYYGSAGGLLDPSVYATSLYVSSSGGQAAGSSAAAAGDVNGDGFADVLLGDPQFASVTSTLTAAGRMQLYVGNRVFDTILRPPAGLVVSARQRQPSTGAPIALGGRVASPDLFLVQLELRRPPAGLVWAAPGPVTARLEVEVKPLGVAYDGQATQLSAPRTITVSGVPYVFELLARRTGPLSVPHRWRARLVFDGNPLEPLTPWITDRGSSTNDAMLRFRNRPREAGGPAPR